MAKIGYKEAGATITYGEVLERAQKSLDHLSHTIIVLDGLIATLSRYSGDTGSNSWEYTALSGRRTQPEGSVPYDVRKDHAGVMQGLAKLRRECAGRYPFAFSALDSKALLNLGCMGAVDLFESDLLSQLKEVRARLSTLLTERRSSFDALNANVLEASTMLPGIMALKDPALSRYLKQDTKSTAALVRDLDEVSDRLSTIRKRNLGKLPASAEEARQVSGDNQAYYDTAVGVTDRGDADQIEAANQITIRSSSSAAIAAISDWSDELLRAQYPISSEFCVEDSTDESPYSSSRDRDTAVALSKARKEKSSEVSKEVAASSGGLVERYSDLLQVPEEEKQEFAQESLDRSLLACQRVLNRLDVPLGRDDDTTRSLAAAGYRDRLSRLRAEARAASSATLKVSLSTKVDALTMAISSALSTD